MSSKFGFHPDRRCFVTAMATAAAALLVIDMLAPLKLDFTPAAFSGSLSDADAETVEDIVDHIDHVVKLVGIEHVGIGTDSDLMGYEHMPPEQYKQLKAGYKASYAFRDKIDTDGFNHPQKMFDLTAALIHRGYSDANIQAVLGGNFRRLLGSTWTVAENKTGEKS